MLTQGGLVSSLEFCLCGKCHFGSFCARSAPQCAAQRCLRNPRAGVRAPSTARLSGFRDSLGFRCALKFLQKVLDERALGERRTWASCICSSVASVAPPPHTRHMCGNALHVQELIRVHRQAGVSWGRFCPRGPLNGLWLPRRADRALRALVFRLLG